MQKNVLGTELKMCCNFPMTGFFRDGFCRVSQEDVGNHSVCTLITQDFLKFSFEQGNDLITPRPEYDFPGLVEGDKWCVCAARWKEAYDAGCAPNIILEATSENALEVISLEVLKEFAVQHNDPL